MPTINELVARALQKVKEIEERVSELGSSSRRTTREWLIERHGHRTPAAVRKTPTKKAA